ncbi:uroporphyrinogen decarboxylase [Capnocytophaga catalasegens]|uniref:Uroporphyrinogen decarboxylase n=1 Tax=Capnocytophaga catalasegens TaxID=1004260 RepID=A0AAV5ASZ7_9FLAO|nr:uroporphyrinogen decarboxylase [Capnocytophaga catalasegens]GIZ16012.1 hypothetical protein RCZ03_20120 [Capnocytophaga catalasegens]GJM50427.1 hypothetical protein RCZ15_14000 [Capnocytophaga catalasegens]GJM51815.1 hypothetical protein RCZ16_01330 [Capnocytophaga catalasegens]
MENWAEYIGYLASVFIVGGFIFKNVRTIRFFNMIGCLCFVTYGFFLTSKPLWPVIVPNGLLALLQIYYLLFKKDK